MCVGAGFAEFGNTFVSKWSSNESRVVQFVYICECYLGRELAEGQRGKAGYRRNRQGVHPQVGSGVGCEVSVCV